MESIAWHRLDSHHDYLLSSACFLKQENELLFQTFELDYSYHT